jgi:hypothetical protein
MTTFSRFALAFGILLSAAALPAVLPAQIDIARPSTRVQRAQLDSMLRIGRADTGTRLSAARWRAELDRRIDNPMELLLANADSLRLTETQVDNIAVINALFLQRSNAIWAPIAEYLAALPDRYDTRAAWTRVAAGAIDEVSALIAYDPAATAVLTNEQLGRLPSVMLSALSTPTASDTRAGGTPR